MGKSAIYVSTEDPLNTKRLAQMLESHPFYTQLPNEGKPSFDHIHALTLNNMDVQQHVIEHQLPFAVERLNAGIVVLDSVAANFRADHETATTNGLVDRAADLNKLGNLLHRLAFEKNVAVVVANQVSDRFAESLLRPTPDILRSSSPASSATPSQRSAIHPQMNTKMSLDHQQRFFTGWGDKPGNAHGDLKTPALGLAWANQIDARIVLKVEAESSQKSGMAHGQKRRRFMNVVFAPWTDQKLASVEYSIELHGLVAKTSEAVSNEHADLLDESLWVTEENDEYA